MAVYRGRYILEGIEEIPDEMLADLDLAYDACMHICEENECRMCGRCCHQVNITVMDDEVERIAARMRMSSEEFEKEYLYRTEGRWLFRKEGRCRFLGNDNKCSIWDERPQICRDFPYLVSKFMSRVYLSIVNDIDIDLSYMEDDWPCTPDIKNSIHALITEAKEKRKKRVTRTP